ncbi:MAG: dihydroneopterin aldolase [Lentisphaeria bacterium]|nr:dihydroneopterin aldolase [Lentisphaeria bacterium]
MKAAAIIGTMPQERRDRQVLCLDLEVRCDGEKASRTDDLRDALDYAAVEREVVATVERSEFFLLEALARAVGETVMKFPQAESCVVAITKPGASARAEITYQAEFFRS